MALAAAPQGRLFCCPLHRGARGQPQSHQQKMGGSPDDRQQGQTDTEGAVHEAHGSSLASHQQPMVHLRLFFMQQAGKLCSRSPP
jgi:hypothetical protein